MADLYQDALRRVLFRLDAETAHDLAVRSLRIEQPWRLMSRRLRVQDPRLHTTLGGLTLENPVGVAPGIDKNAKIVSTLQDLGFGYVMVGSILPGERPGNPRPRVLRYPEQESLINCYGLPSDGLERCVARLRRARRGVPVVANIDAPTVEQYVRSLEAVQPYVDAVELGLQCPNNTDDPGNFHTPAVFEELIGAVMERRTKPILVKMVAWQSTQDRDNRLDLIDRGVRLGVGGFTIPGTWSQSEQRLSIGRGHVSGRMAFSKTVETVRAIREVTGDRASIKALGGISSGRDAYEVIQAGAATVELLSAFVYQGWRVAERINTELLEILDREQIPSLAALRGSAPAAAASVAAVPSDAEPGVRA
ncbi:MULTISPECIES: dihydroorotate dehydrogenase 2 [unclassified Blastococcus]